MKIPEINMISDFEAGMKCLQIPSLISRFFSFPGIEVVPQVYSFWKWGALFFAIFATCSSIIRRIKLILTRFHTVKPSSHHQNEETVEFSEDDEISSASSDDDDERGGGEDRRTTSFGGKRRVDDDFRVKGSSRLFRGHSRRRSCGGAWSEFANGKSVVDLWDSLGLSLDLDEDLFDYDSQSVVSNWDDDRERRKFEFFGGIWGISVEARTVVLTVEDNRKGDGVILDGYDTRMRRGVPILYAEWSSPAIEKVASTTTKNVGKICIKDDVSGLLTVGDVRNVRWPLESVRESDGDTWLDANAVNLGDECVHIKRDRVLPS